MNCNAIYARYQFITRRMCFPRIFKSNKITVTDEKIRSVCFLQTGYVQASEIYGNLAKDESENKSSKKINIDDKNEVELAIFQAAKIMSFVPIREEKIDRFELQQAIVTRDKILFLEISFFHFLSTYVKEIRVCITCANFSFQHFFFSTDRLSFS